MESLTAKIIAFSLELPEFYVSFFFFLLDDCPKRGVDCITMPMDPPSKSVRVFFPSTVSEDTSEHKKNG